MAIVVRVTSGPAAGPVNGAFINVSGATIGEASCVPQTDASVCHVLGPAGKYDLDVGAAGFQTTHRTVTVHEYQPGGCACNTVTTEHLAVALVASP
jgi:hypothetical protein